MNIYDVLLDLLDAQCVPSLLAIMAYNHTVYVYPSYSRYAKYLP